MFPHRDFDFVGACPATVTLAIFFLQLENRAARFRFDIRALSIEIGLPS